MHNVIDARRKSVACRDRRRSKGPHLVKQSTGQTAPASIADTQQKHHVKPETEQVVAKFGNATGCYASPRAPGRIMRGTIGQFGLGEKTTLRSIRVQLGS